MEMCGSGFHNGGANGDIELALAVEPEPADCACIKAAGFGFEFSNDLACALLRRAGDRSAGETRPQCSHVIDILPQISIDGGDEMEDLLKAFQL